MKFTILGATGFIGSHFKSFLEQKDVEVFTPGKQYRFQKSENLGHVVYCIGLTADFRSRPLDTIHAHVIRLLDVLENARFESFLYLSSTRVYSGASGAKETDNLTVNSSSLSDLYNLSKLMGESACLALPDKTTRVARLSNVIGNDFSSGNFLFSILKEAVDQKKIHLNSRLDASKNYILIEDVLQLLYAISLSGRERVYNVASDFSTRHDEVIQEMKKWTDFELIQGEVKEDLKFPEIDTNRVKAEFGYKSHNVLGHIQQLIKQYKNT